MTKHFKPESFAQSVRVKTSNLWASLRSDLLFYFFVSYHYLAFNLLHFMLRFILHPFIFISLTHNKRLKLIHFFLIKSDTSSPSAQALEDGSYLLFRDPNKAEMHFVEIPEGHFDNETDVAE